MANATPFLPKTNSAWSGFKDIQITDVVETTCNSIGIGRQTPETLPCESRESRPHFNDGPWNLVRFSTDKILPEDFDLDRLLSHSGIIIDMVPHIVQHKHSRSYELVVATSCLHLLSEKFHDFKLVVDYDLSEPAEEDIRIHGIWEAKKRARINILSNAAEATRKGWGCGPAECYRSAIGQAGPGTDLERAILNWDIQHSDASILKRFTQNLLFLCLNCCDRYDTLPALDVLRRDENEWLQFFGNDHTDLSELLMAADVPTGIREGSEQQTISLFRSLLESSGGENLPSQLLCGFDARQVDQIRFQFEQTYRRLPSLRKEENNILLLLTWSFEVLSDWIDSEESLNLYQRLVDDLWLQQTPEEFALTLAALLCHERLLPYTRDDTAQPSRGSYFADLDATLNGTISATGERSLNK
ncbi:MAG: hypothetical protein Q9170_002191 [Blastenia crenularia]